MSDPVQASKVLVDHALARFSTDNLSCMIVRFNKTALLDSHANPSSAIGVEGDLISTGPNKISEVEKIVGDAHRKVAEGGAQLGISGSNSGKGHDPVPVEEQLGDLDRMERVVEEEPQLVESEEANEMTPSGADQIDDETKSTLKGLPAGVTGGADTSESGSQ